MIDYKYDEDKTLTELKSYIDRTYKEHYSHNKFQATEFIIDGGHGEGFCIGNVLKYAQRYGKKNGKDRNDLLKVIHYGIIALYVNKLEKKKMKLSNHTTSVLKNFATINQNLVIKEGNEMSTMSAMKNIVARVQLSRKHFQKRLQYMTSMNF